jgi:glycosyltransferase involved in cell wall biosynthesis
MLNSTTPGPKVSIVIPVYNGANFLREAIDSALAQTYKNTEVLVINDGSNDQGATEQIALSYGSRIRYFSKENGGVATALNKGIAEMSGTYFSWLSHDDLYRPDKIEVELSAAAKLHRDDIVIYSDYSTFSSDLMAAIPIRRKSIAPEKFRYSLLVDVTVHGCTLLIPKVIFERVGVFNEQLRTTQDYDLWFRIASEFDFIHIPEVLVMFRIHASQGTQTQSELALAECDELFSGFIRVLGAKEILSASVNSHAKSYGKIAAHMFNRGLFNAGYLAEGLAAEKSTPVATLLRGIGYRKNRIIKVQIKPLIRKLKINTKIFLTRLST